MNFDFTGLQREESVAYRILGSLGEIGAFTVSELAVQTSSLIN